LLDTYAWVEFFKGTEKGAKVNEIIKSMQCFTSIISLAELSEWIERENLNRNEIIGGVKKSSAIINLDEELIELAGKINFHKKKEIKGFGMIDAIILATSKIYGLKIVTGDQHFKSEENAIIL